MCTREHAHKSRCRFITMVRVDTQTYTCTRCEHELYIGMDNIQFKANVLSFASLFLLIAINTATTTITITDATTHYLIPFFSLLPWYYRCCCCCWLWQVEQLPQTVKDLLKPNADCFFSPVFTVFLFSFCLSLSLSHFFLALRSFCRFHLFEISVSCDYVYINVKYLCVYCAWYSDGPVGANNNNNKISRQPRKII